MYTLNLYSIIGQFYLNKAWGNKKPNHQLPPRDLNAALAALYFPWNEQGFGTGLVCFRIQASLLTPTGPSPSLSAKWG